MRAFAFAIVAAAACAHAPDLPLRPDPSPPPGSTTDTFVAADGTELLARHWPAKGATKAVVVIMHGLKDYSSRYAHMADVLTADGYAVYAFDLRGHGRSAGPRVAPRHWTDYVDDLDRFLTRVEGAEPGKHIYLFGHSMGGAVAALAAERHRPVLAGLVLSGPAIVADAAPLKIAGAMFAGALTPKAPALALDNHDFSSDPNNAAAMDKDELISQPAAPARTAAGLLRGMSAIWHGVDKLTMPLLALHGTADKLTAPWGSRALVALAPTTDKTVRFYRGANHDLVHEPGGRGDEVVHDIVAWLDAHEGGPAVAAGPPLPPARMLVGHPQGWTQAVELAGGISVSDTTTRFAGRIVAELARPALGWHIALIAERIDGKDVVAIQPIGVGAHGGNVAIGVSAGGAIVDAEAGTAFAVSGAGWFEASLGPVHLGALFEAEGPVGGGQPAPFFLYSCSLRLGRDHHYWPGARAGVGPVITGGAISQSDDGKEVTDYFGMIGVELFGAD